MKEKTIRILEDIRKYRNSQDRQYSDEEIRSILGIKIRMYQRYLEIIHKQDKEAWLNVTRTQLEPEMLKLKASYEETYQTAKEEVQNATTTQDKLLASECKDGARLDIIRLLTDGPEYVKKIDEYVTEKHSKQKETNPQREITN